MGLKADVYRVKLRFGRLFADPRIFDSSPSFVRDFLQSRGLSKEKAEEIYETTEVVSPLDDSGRPSIPSGTGKFRYQGKTLRSEFMQGANIELEYSDFGSGLGPEDHRDCWIAGRWDDLSFEMKHLYHQRVDTGVAEVAELYNILKARASPTTMATVELPSKSGGSFEATVKYLEDRLGSLGKPEGRSVEVYAAQNLDVKERKTLETRIGREATPSTVYVILTSRT